MPISKPRKFFINGINCQDNGTTWRAVVCGQTFDISKQTVQLPEILTHLKRAKKAEALGEPVEPFLREAAKLHRV